MRSSLVSRVCAAILATSISTQALAAEFQLELKSDFSPKPVVVEGKDGVWFPNEDAEYLLKLRVETVPGLVGAINSQQKTIDGLDLQLKLSTDKDKIRDSQVQLLQKTLTDTEKRLQTELDKSISWYRDNKLWAGVGFVAGILITGYVVKAIK
jgi:hypothetical protein